MDRRQPGTDDARDRIQGYLDRSGLAPGKPRVVPLTGDASDRRYFRILLPVAPSIVLALNSAPFEVLLSDDHAAFATYVLYVQASALE